MQNPPSSPHIQRPQRSKFPVKWAGLIIVCASLALAWVFKNHREEQLKTEARALEAKVSAPAEVKTFKVKWSSGVRSIRLLGEVHPGQEATIYSKVSGYLKSITVDKGDSVKTGQILAIIESQETEHAYAGALADAQNKKRVAERFRKLARKNMVSVQEAEQAIANAKVAVSNLNSLETIRSYETIRAPFAGRITARFADQGALIQSAANSQASALPIVTLSESNRVRVFVYIDQSNALLVKAGQAVEIKPEDPSASPIAGQISRVAGTLDPRTRSLLAEADFDNHGERLIPGSVVDVVLKVSVPKLLEIPVESIVYRLGKPHVAVVGSGSKLQLKEIQIADTDGKYARVKSEISEGDELALGLPSGVADGALVRAIASEKAPEAPKASK